MRLQQGGRRRAGKRGPGEVVSHIILHLARRTYGIEQLLLGISHPEPPRDEFARNRGFAQYERYCCDERNRARCQREEGDLWEIKYEKEKHSNGEAREGGFEEL